MGPITRSYERLTREGKIGIGRTDLTLGTDGRLRVGPDCDRSGCHRTARRRVRNWNLCDPCADAIAAVKENQNG